MRILFAGTPAAALPTLDALADSRHDIVQVLTRADSRAGRGRVLRPSPVKQRATELGLPIGQPRTLRDAAAIEELAAIDVDVAVVVAYGLLIPAAALALPPHGWINVHFSLLPAWRGAAPVQHSIWAGDDIGGVTTFRLDEGLDTGPILGRATETIRPSDTSGTLLERLSHVGADLLVATLDALEAGALIPEPQAADGVSLAPRIAVADALVDWAAPSYRVHRQVRAMTPEPGAWTWWRGTRLKIRPGEVIAGESALAGRDTLPGNDEKNAVTWNDTIAALAPGELATQKNQVVVGTAQGAYRLREVAPAGKGWMDAAAWARGARPAAGERFSDAEDKA